MPVELLGKSVEELRDLLVSLGRARLSWPADLSRDLYRTPV